jgi:hypothetical protein
MYPKLLQAKQAADLHSPSFNQRMVSEVLKDGFLDRHVPTIRALYKSQRDAMLAALTREMAGLGLEWNTPVGGIVSCGPACRRAWTPRALLPKAVIAAWPSCRAPRSIRTTPIRDAAAVVRHRDGGANRHRHRGAGRHPPGSLEELSMLRIWGRISSINVRKVVLAAQLLDIPFERIDAGAAFGIVKTPEYLARNPNALVPRWRTTASCCGNPT